MEAAEQQDCHVMDSRHQEPEGARVGSTSHWTSHVPFSTSRWSWLFTAALSSPSSGVKARSRTDPKEVSKLLKSLPLYDGHYTQILRVEGDGGLLPHLLLSWNFKCNNLLLSYDYHVVILFSFDGKLERHMLIECVFLCGQAAAFPF